MNNKLHKRKQIKYFNKDISLYEEYEKSLNAWRWSYINKIKNDFLRSNFKNKTLIDIGTGSGHIAIEMARLGMNVIAADISPFSLNKIKKYCKNINLKSLTTLSCSAENIPIKSGTVDYLVSNSVLEHVCNENDAIQEYKRILSRSGRIFVTVPLKMFYTLPLFWPINYIYDKKLGHLRRYSLEELKNKFKMKIVKVYYTGHFIKYLWLLISRLFLGGIRKSSDLDYIFEKIDRKFETKYYGGSNITVIFEK